MPCFLSQVFCPSVHWLFRLTNFIYVCSDCSLLVWESAFSACSHIKTHKLLQPNPKYLWTWSVHHSCIMLETFSPTVMHGCAQPPPHFPLLSPSQTIQTTPMLFQISAKSVWCHLQRNEWPSSPNAEASRKLRSDSLSQTICHMAVRPGQFMKGWGNG